MTTRVIAGPFNRVEGDLELALTLEDGVIASAEVTTTLYRGFEQLLLRRPPLDALAIAPRICGICSVSQSVAASAALRALTKEEAAPNGLLATNIAHAAENMADHLTHFYLFFMPDFARASYAGRPWFSAVEERFKATSGTAQAEILPLRRRLLEVMGLIAGKWPHSLAFQPGGLTRVIATGEKVQLLAILSEFAAGLERTLFGLPLERVLAIETLDELEALGTEQGGRGDFFAFLRLADDLSLERMGPGPGPLLSFGAYHAAEGAFLPAGLWDGTALQPLDVAAIAEDVTCAHMDESAGDPFAAVTQPRLDKPGAYSFAKAPRLAGQPVEVGALARLAVAGHPLVRDMLAREGRSSVRARIIARMLELAMLAHQSLGWVRAMRLADPFAAHFPLPDQAQGAGLVEAARGALGHWLSVSEGTISGYQIIAPTTWNFSPRDASGQCGPLEGALAGTEVGSEGAKAAAIQHIIRSFDPCMVCTAH